MWGGTEEPQVWFIANLKCDMPGLPNQLDEYCCLICLYMVNSFSLLVFLTTITWKITRQAATYLFSLGYQRRIMICIAYDMHSSNCPKKSSWILGWIL